MTRNATTERRNPNASFAWLALEADAETAELAVAVARALKRRNTYGDGAMERALGRARVEALLGRALDLGKAYLLAADSAKRVWCERPAPTLADAQSGARAAHQLFANAASRRLDAAARAGSVSLERFRDAAASCFHVVRSLEGPDGAGAVALAAVTLASGSAVDAAREWTRLARAARTDALRRQAAANAVCAWVDAGRPRAALGLGSLGPIRDGDEIGAALALNRARVALVLGDVRALESCLDAAADMGRGTRFGTTIASRAEEMLPFVLENRSRLVGAARVVAQFVVCLRAAPVGTGDAEGRP